MCLCVSHKELICALRLAIKIYRKKKKSREKEMNWLNNSIKYKRRNTEKCIALLVWMNLRPIEAGNVHVLLVDNNNNWCVSSCHFLLTFFFLLLFLLLNLWSNRHHYGYSRTSFITFCQNRQIELLRFYLCLYMRACVFMYVCVCVSIWNVYAVCAVHKFCCR